jgi:hypothetical protein
MVVEPSQGSHFFQNLTSFMVAYFTVNSLHNKGYVNWDWLLSVDPYAQKKYTKHLRFNNPLLLKMNGHKNKGIIMIPEENADKPGRKK